MWAYLLTPASCPAHRPLPWRAPFVTNFFLRLKSRNWGWQSPLRGYKIGTSWTQSYINERRRGIVRNKRALQRKDHCWEIFGDGSPNLPRSFVRAPAGAKYNVASALRANRVYICYHTYMNKGGTAERIGPCDEGLIVPAVLYFYIGNCETRS